MESERGEVICEDWRDLGQRLRGRSGHAVGTGLTAMSPPNHLRISERRRALRIRERSFATATIR